MATTIAKWRGVSAQQSSEPTRQDVIARAVEILGPNEGGLTAEEIIRRLNEVRNVVQGQQIPQRERRELNRMLMNIAIREPNATDEARAIIHQIFKQLASPEDVSSPKRDENGRIIPRTDVDFPLKLLEESTLPEGDLEQPAC